MCTTSNVISYIRLSKNYQDYIGDFFFMYLECIYSVKLIAIMLLIRSLKSGCSNFFNINKGHRI